LLDTGIANPRNPLSGVLHLQQHSRERMTGKWYNSAKANAICRGPHESQNFPYSCYIIVLSQSKRIYFEAFPSRNIFEVSCESANAYGQETGIENFQAIHLREVFPKLWK
jgi:hypothetical protein